MGSGLGWLLIPSGAFTADFWVAEAYPFLSMYANPHFPLGLALVLYLLTPKPGNKISKINFIQTGFIALLLSVINPFGVVIVLMVIGGNLIWLWISKHELGSMIYRFMASAIFGLPVLIYDYWIANVDPAFRSWNAQNLTASPPIWDVVVALSPALILALLSGIRRWRQHEIANNQPVTLLVVWTVFGLIMLYLPFSLQRRFMMGLYVPLAGLAAVGVEALAGPRSNRFKTLTGSLFLLAVPTNLIILLAAFSGIQSRDHNIYLTRAEYTALTWIGDNTEAESVIMASPEMGLFIPAHTGRRVIYGHPFETVAAEESEKLVLAFYAGEDIDPMLAAHNVNYILLGPREHQLAQEQSLPGVEAVYSQDGVEIFKVTSP